ncbi:MAG: helix-turn-helix domain-containing protein [Geodermatophilaceae bacterium]
MTGLPDPRERPWLTVAELAGITGEGTKALRVAVASGQIPSLRIGRYIRIPTAPLRALLGLQGTDTGPATVQTDNGAAGFEPAATAHTHPEVTTSGATNDDTTRNSRNGATGPRLVGLDSPADPAGRRADQGHRRRADPGTPAAG